MTGRIWRINTYLLAAAVAVAAGCATEKTPEDKPKGKSKSSRKTIAVMRLFAQANPDGTSFTQEATIYRANPVRLSVSTSPLITELNIVRAELIDDIGGYSIRLFLDRSGALILENATTSHLNSRLAVYSAWGMDKPGEGRWLSAVYIARRITDGVFSFTPDASREEAEQIVAGLNNMADKLRARGDQ